MDKVRVRVELIGIVNTDILWDLQTIPEFRQGIRRDHRARILAGFIFCWHAPGREHFLSRTSGNGRIRLMIPGREKRAAGEKAHHHPNIK